MSAASLYKRKAYFAVSAMGLVFSAGYLTLSFQLPFGEIDRPGAAVFPVIVGVIVLLASIATFHEAWQMEQSEQVPLPAGKDLSRILGLVGLLLGYLVALPWVGQVIASMLFFVFLMRLISSYSWKRILVSSMTMSLSIYAVFVFLLQVPMPVGILDF